MKNDDRNPVESVHLFVALRRRKDNDELQAICLREIIYDYEVDLNNLKNRLDGRGGTWRIHKTINKRNVAKAMKVLQHAMIDNPEYVASHMASVWKTSLMHKTAKESRNILLDVDSREANEKVRRILIANDIDTVAEARTPNGYHYVLSNPDTRLFADIPDVDIKRDAYIFLEVYEADTDRYK